MAVAAPLALELEVYQAQSNYRTKDQKLLGRMLMLSSQSCLLDTNPIMWFCDQEPVQTFQTGPPPAKRKIEDMADLCHSVQVDYLPYMNWPTIYHVITSMPS